MTLAGGIWTPRGGYLTTVAGTANSGIEGLSGVAGKFGLITVSYSAYSSVDMLRITEDAVDANIPPEDILDILEAAHRVSGDHTWEVGQVAVVTPYGNAIHTGPGCLDFSDRRHVDDAVFVMNFAKSPDVLDAIERGWRSSTTLNVATRLEDAMYEGVLAGGDVRPERSTATLWIPPTKYKQLLTRRTNLSNEPLLANIAMPWKPLDHPLNQASREQNPISALDRLIDTGQLEIAREFGTHLWETTDETSPFRDVIALDLAIASDGLGDTATARQLIEYLEQHHPDRIEVGVRLGSLDPETHMPIARAATPDAPAHRHVELDGLPQHLQQFLV